MTHPTRRDFLNTGSAAMAGATFIPGPRPVDPTIKIGLVGCGGRGTGAAVNMLVDRPRVELTAMGDIFQSQIDRSLTGMREYRTKDKSKVPGINVVPDNLFTGPDAYKKVIDSDIDLVLLVTPPYCRPEHFEYAVKAGKHVFIEKPCATDAAGINKILALEDEVNRKGLNVVAGFERRLLPYMQETRKRLQDGAIGEMTTGFAYFNTNSIWWREKQPGMTDRDFWFYNWYHVDWMSGDHIVEQAVHSPDIINWIFDEHPVKAYGMGGRQFHTDRGGNIYDHFAVEYEYASGRRMNLQARQISDTDGKFAEDILGSKGWANLTYVEGAQIYGANPWDGKYAQDTSIPWQNQNQNAIEADFVIDSVRENKRTNELRAICDSTFTCILGREAAYTGKVVEWDALLATNHKIVPDDLAAWDGTINPVAKPGDKRW